MGESPAWYATNTFRRVVWGVAALILMVSFVNGVLKKDNDYRNHYLLGQAFMEGKPYLIPDQPPYCSHYPVGRLALDVAFAVFPYRLSRGLWWAVSLVVLFYSLRLWERLARHQRSVTPAVSFAATAFALLVTLPWLVRDLDDCGQQLLLLGILTAAGALVLQRRPWPAGAFLGLAATYKLTPILFLPLLVYKRRWKEAAWMLVFILALNLILPALRLGLPLTWRANQLFFAKAREAAQAVRADPTANGVEAPKHTNKNLRMALGRYLQTYPPGHPLFIPRHEDLRPDGTVGPEARPHPLFVQFLNLPAPVAGTVATSFLLLFALVLAVRYRRPWTRPGFQSDFASEWAAVVGLCALLSPLCWSQHLVLFIPAVLLSIRADLEGAPRWRVLAMWTAALLILGHQRDLLGRDLWLIADSYKLETLAALLLIALVLTIRISRLAPASPEGLVADMSPENVVSASSRPALP